MHRAGGTVPEGTFSRLDPYGEICTDNCTLYIKLEVSVEAIVPVEQKTVDFYGTELIAVRDPEGEIWVPLRRLCEAIGIRFHGQLAKVQEDPVMSQQLQSVPVTLADGRTYEMECLSLKFVRAWLFGINANRVKAEVRERLIQYQLEVIEVIDRHFSSPLTTTPPDPNVLHLMRNQAAQMVQLWDTLIDEQRRLRAAEEFITEMDDRLTDQERTTEAILARLEALRQEQAALLSRYQDIVRVLPAPRDPIGPAQKAAIKALVDDIVASAGAKGVRLGQGRNDYPAVWDAFKRRFDLAKYDELSLAQYQEATEWLKAWLDRIRA